jgi:hypothetical protein
LVFAFTVELVVALNPFRVLVPSFISPALCAGLFVLIRFGRIFCLRWGGVRLSLEAAQKISRRFADGFLVLSVNLWLIDCYAKLICFFNKFL